MERPNAWKKYDDATLAELDELCEDYRRYISENKTERECVKSSIKLAEEAGYVSLETALAEGRTLKAGDKVYAASHNKTLMLVNLGRRPMEQGMNILGAHIDSPRLDLKQNPLYEAGDMGHGLCFNKYTGSRGKGGSNDADAEYFAQIRDIMDEAGVDYQTCELGRIGAGGGGTIAYILAEYGMDVIDSGVAVISMHALWEVANKADIYEAYKGYKAFIERP